MNTNPQLTLEQEADLQERLTRAQEGIQDVLNKEQFLLDASFESAELKISTPIKLISTKRYEFDLPEEANPTEKEILGSLKAHDDLTYVSDKSNPEPEMSGIGRLNKATENNPDLLDVSGLMSGEIEGAEAAPILSPYNTHDDDQNEQTTTTN